MERVAVERVALQKISAKNLDFGLSVTDLSNPFFPSYGFKGNWFLVISGYHHPANISKDKFIGRGSTIDKEKNNFIQQEDKKKEQSIFFYFEIAMLQYKS